MVQECAATRAVGLAPTWSPKAERVAAAVWAAAISGASRQVVAAATAAALRVAMEVEDAEVDLRSVAVPADVARDVPKVAEAFAAQRAVSRATGQTCRSAGQAYKAARPLVCPETASALRTLKRARDTATHGSRSKAYPVLTALQR